MKRKIKISFRRKHGSRTGTLEVYTAVRIPGVKHSRRTHICYLAASSARFESLDRAKIVEKASCVFRDLNLSDEVEIDWENAKQKLLNLDNPKKVVDRQIGKAQIESWRRVKEEGEGANELLPEFASTPTKPSTISGDLFFEIFTKIHEKLAESLPGEDPAEIANWWEEFEAPRLVHSFHRFVTENHKDCDGPFFTPEGFLEHLGNRFRRFKIADFLRWKNSKRLPPGI